MGAVIGAFAAWLATLFTKEVTLKIAKTAAFATTVAVLTFALIAGIETAVAPLAVALPENVLQFVSSVLPTNLSTCVSIVIVARIARWAYDWNIRFAKNLAQ